ncbi:PIN domain nuclease [Silanimonas sp.]|uniref:type II toxin-antitoxin system VapC family toxin n=1 Tax=Silanimonas sp. TaxID=1929290 RepID=UPI001BBA2421|nr:PIN domain nuclease [Silanimonas sp.]MBS3895224.1 PIN domain nuclease [Silanimonas sp.]MBS3924908.1 PIN domain nuclease [Xanthomonadaceae bacterium]
MIFVDTSVWVDFFRGTASAQAEWLDRHLGSEGLVIGDLVLAEVLQGFKDDRGFNEAKRLLGQLEQVNVVGIDLAVEAARNYRRLRARGVTVRGTVDVLIATRCISDGLRLLHADRDFEGFAEHLGLQVVDCGP